MTELQKNNELIRVFLGDAPFNKATHNPELTYTNGGYHKSWDSIINVIHKIDEIRETNTNAHDFIEMSLEHIAVSTSDVLLTANIEGVYVDIIKFIKAFNKNFQ